jgi:hypothetical protein
MGSDRSNVNWQTRAFHCFSFDNASILEKIIILKGEATILFEHVNGFEPLATRMTALHQ